MAKIRLLLVDDHCLLREGLRSLIELQSDLEVVGEADNGPTSLRMPRNSAPTWSLWTSPSGG